MGATNQCILLQLNPRLKQQKMLQSMIDLCFKPKNHNLLSKVSIEKLGYIFTTDYCKLKQKILKKKRKTMLARPSVKRKLSHSGN